MGSITDAKIAAWQEHAGLKPATGKRADALARLQGLALDLIKVCELERSGIRDGDGYWHGGEPLAELTRVIGHFTLPLDDKPEAMEKAKMMKVDNYFGGCPHCGQNDGFINVGRSHWFFCKTHKTSWCVGSNLFSSWREQSEEEQRRIYDEIGLDEFTEVKPLPCTNPSVAGDANSDNGETLPF